VVARIGALVLVAGFIVSASAIGASVRAAVTYHPAGSPISFQLPVYWSPAPEGYARMEGAIFYAGGGGGASTFGVQDSPATGSSFADLARLALVSATAVIRQTDPPPISQ
jgi:hypothetical protein